MASNTIQNGRSCPGSRRHQNRHAWCLFIAQAATPGGIQRFSRFRNPLVLILMASILSAATGDATSATVIAVMVLMSVILDFVQEYRAGLAAESGAPGGGGAVRAVGARCP